MEPEWRKINGFNYYVSSDGEIRNYNGIHLKQHIQNGYKRLTLIKNGKQHKLYVHRIIAEAFIENPLNKPFIDHINRIKTDNRIENLRWCSCSENNLNKGKENLNEEFIWFDKRKNKFRVRIDEKNICKYFKTLEEAKEYRNKNNLNK